MKIPQFLTLFIDLEVSVFRQSCKSRSLPYYHVTDQPDIEHHDRQYSAQKCPIR